MIKKYRGSIMPISNKNSLVEIMKTLTRNTPKLEIAKGLKSAPSFPREVGKAIAVRVGAEIVYQSIKTAYELFNALPIPSQQEVELRNNHVNKQIDLNYSPPKLRR